jgi:uncharacterized protein (DUF1499 family)
MIGKILAGLLIVLALVAAFGFYQSAQAPADLWAVGKTFAACPNRPSCVSSVATDEGHRIAPLAYTGDAASARARLERVVLALPGTSLVQSTPEYLHVLFVTPKMHFRDDVELLVQPDGVIQVRSISRFGYSDHGINRARVETLREAFAKS